VFDIIEPGTLMLVGSRALAIEPFMLVGRMFDTNDPSPMKNPPVWTDAFETRVGTGVVKLPAGSVPLTNAPLKEAVVPIKTDVFARTVLNPIVEGSWAFLMCERLWAVEHLYPQHIYSAIYSLFVQFAIGPLYEGDGHGN
jgi:hypothetical protein